MPKEFGPKPPRKSATLNIVIYRVPPCQKVLAPNSPKVLQCQTVIHRVPQRSPPKKPKVPQMRCYLQDSTMPEGFDPKPPRSSAVPNAVIYRVPQCQKVLAPNLPKLHTVIYRVPQTLKVLAPNNPKVPRPTLLYTWFCNAKRCWLQTFKKFRNAKHCYLQGSAMPKGFGPQPPGSSAMPNTVIYRVPQRLQVLAPKKPKVMQSQTLLFTRFRNAKRFWPQTSQTFCHAKHCYL